jgi:hypothetical protein
MALDEDTILLENFRESLQLYQRALVWAMTAAAAFFLLTLSLGDPQPASISILYGRLSGPAAWVIAMGMFVVLGILAGSSLSNAEAALAKLRVGTEIREAILLYPSLATTPNGFVRIGTVLLSPAVVMIGFGLELYRESDVSAPRGVAWGLGLLMWVMLVVAPYASIAYRLWHQLGSRPYPQKPVASPADSGQS